MKKKLHKRRIGTKIVSTVLASTLFLPPISPIFQHGQLIGFEQNTAQADPLASVRILDNTELTADARETDPTEPYTLDMTLTGRGLADADLVNPETVAVFYAPQLAGDLGENATANVAVEILPITLSDIPALGDTLSGLTGTLTTTLSEVLGLVDDLLVMLPGVDINGVDELSEAFNALNTLDVAVEDLLAYSENIPAEDITVNENGVVTVNFSDGIDNHLNTAINETVLGLVNDVIDAAQALEVDLGLLDILPFAQELVNSILGLVTDSVLPLAQGLVNDLAGATLDLTGDLAAAQVIGNTTVNVSVPVDRSTSMAGQEVRVSGNVVNTADIDAQLLSDLDNSDTTTLVQMPEAADTTAPTITPIDDVEAIEGQDITPIEVTADEPATFTVEGLPEGVTYDEDASTITGAPAVNNWEDGQVEQEFEIGIEAVDEAGNVSTESFVLTVLRDSDGDGIPDIDEEPEDTTAPAITPIDDVEAVEGEDIAPIEATADEPATFTVEGLPEGVTYDEDASTITGAPAVNNWEDGQVEQAFDVEIQATDEAGNVGTESFVLTVLRDSDGDGIPDIDEEPEDTTAPVIDSIDNVPAVENQAIEAIAVTADEPATFTVEGLPEGVTYNEDASTITGTPVIDDWAEDEVARPFAVIVEATDEAGNTDLETFVMTVQRDSNGDGIPDVDDTVDMTAPTIDSIDDFDAIDNQAIAPVDVIVDEASDIAVDGLPEGITYDPDASEIAGAPALDWADGELQRNFAVIVEATDDAGNTGVETFVITVYRDSNNDGTPDVEDPSDEDTTAPMITPIDNVETVESQDIEPIEVVTDEESTIEVSNLPDGVYFDEDSSTIEGAPVIDDWEEDEVERDFAVVVSATDEAGNTGLESFVMTVQRDSDGNGIPDVDEPGDTEAPVISPIDNATAIEGQDIETIDVVTDEESTIEVSNLPDGVYFDEGSSAIVGTPTIDDWEENEVERDFAVVVAATDEADNTGLESFVMTVQRDSDGDGTPDIDEEEPEDSTTPEIEPIDDFDAVEYEPIEPVEIIVDEDSTVAVDGLPSGVDYNPSESVIEGTPVIEDWAEDEFTRDFEVVVEAINEEGNTGTEEFVVTVERALDDEDTTAPVITPIDDFNAVENQPIDPVEVIVDEDSTVAVDGLPSGVDYNPSESVIEGTPIIEDWAEDEFTRDFVVVVEATDEAGNTGTEEFVVTIERDSNDDGTSNVEDDDNGDVNGEDTTPPVITPIPDQTVEENEPIEDIPVETDEPSEVVVDGLPDGLEYDLETGIIGGTPVINDWNEGETEREFTVTITAEDDAGNVSSMDFSFVIERDLSGLGGVNDGSDSTDSSQLPQTGESQSITTSLLGIASLAIGAIALAWTEKRKGLNEE